jgi:agmatinase
VAAARETDYVGGRRIANMAKKTSGPGKRGIDHAITRESVYGLRAESTHSGVLSFLRAKYTRDLAGIDVAVTGIPYDLAVTNRAGARFGPRGVRAASAQLAWGPLWPWDHDPLARLAVVDYGDCDIDHGNPHEIPQRIEDHIDGILETGASSIAIGGDHFITLPIMRAYAKRHGPLAMVHFDAHSDTWREETKRSDHGTMFYHGVEEGVIDPEHSVQIGIRTHNPDRLGITWLDAKWVHENGPEKVIEETKKITGGRPAYLTFDIDCLDPAFAPGTGTPVAGGLSSYQACRILGGLDGIDFKGMDLVEVAPQYDISEITALAGATLIMTYLQMRTEALPDKV